MTTLLTSLPIWSESLVTRGLPRADRDLSLESPSPELKTSRVPTMAEDGAGWERHAQRPANERPLGLDTPLVGQSRLILPQRDN